MAGTAAVFEIVSAAYGVYSGIEQTQMAKKAFNQSNPFGAYRPEYGAKLEGLMNDPSSVTKDPGYQFQFQQGQQAVDRSMAAKGYLGSGNEAIALTEYGQGFAQNYLHQQEEFLANLAGAGISPSSATQSIGAFNQGNQQISDSAGAFQYLLGSFHKPSYAGAGTPSGQGASVAMEDLAF